MKDTHNSIPLSESEKLFEKGQATYLEWWKSFLRFQSISTDPAYDAQCKMCATWLAELLGKMGFTVEIKPTSVKPVLIAHRKGLPGKPHVLVYGHYDVQPIDPLELWQSNPFEPEMRDGRLYARGANDDKGQLTALIAGLDSVINAGKMEASVTLLIEGEEESASIGIAEVLPTIADRIKADVLMVADTSCESLDRPAIIAGVRGIVYLTVTLRGPARDLHSGLFGGMVVNPATALARLISRIHNDDGSIAIPGFYDGVDKVTSELIRLVTASKIDPKEFQAECGTSLVGGETSLPPELRRGVRPTVEINGIHSGYGGPGTKTIIPAEAFCKITARLVGKQDPKKCLEALCQFLEVHTPEGVSLEISEEGIGGSAMYANTSGRFVTKAKAVLDGMSGGKAVFLWNGGSLPILAEIVNISRAEPVLVGFGLSKDAIHSPNESYGLDQFKAGFIYTTQFLSLL